MPSKSETVRVPVTPELRAEIEAVATQADVSLAHVIRRAIRFYLDDRAALNTTEGKGRA